MIAKLTLFGSLIKLAITNVLNITKNVILFNDLNIISSIFYILFIRGLGVFVLFFRKYVFRFVLRDLKFYCDLFFLCTSATKAPDTNWSELFSMIFSKIAGSVNG